MLRFLLIFLLAGCAHVTPEQTNLAAGKRYFATQNYTSALQTLIPLAQGGDATALYAVGYMRYYGLGTQKDETAGLTLIRKAARLGNRRALKALMMINPTFAHAKPLHRQS